MSVSGARIAIPDTRRLIHLQFRRFAGCPVCNLHLHSFSRRHGEIEAANIREVVVFHSSAEQLAKYAKDLPFALVPDPDRKLYKEFGVDTSLRALLDPRVWVFIIAGISHSLFEIVTRKYAVPTLAPEGGRLGPACGLTDCDQWNDIGIKATGSTPMINGRWTSFSAWRVRLLRRHAMIATPS